MAVVYNLEGFDHESFQPHQTLEILLAVVHCLIVFPPTACPVTRDRLTKENVGKYSQSFAWRTEIRV